MFAQVDSDDFNIRVLIGADVTLPSTPVLLTASPIASTQIDLTWSSSTDNLIVSGYVLFRDGSVIASTSLLVYSDTGLAASTTYSYTVRSFDSSLNYSTSSNSLSTTTLAIPVVLVTPTETNDSVQGTAVRVVVDKFLLKTGLSTSSLIVDTVRPARLEMRWGRSGDYELGYIVSNVYKKRSSLLLTDLEPGTAYQYEIIGYSPYGRSTVIREGEFTTKSESITALPPNVRRFIAEEKIDDVFLSWQLPQGDISKVRIVRSHLGFSKYPRDGAVVYQGLGTGVRDEGILDKYSPVYYTAFVYDDSGNVSSGAVALVYSTVEEGGISTYSQDKYQITEEATSSIEKERVTPIMRMPDLSEMFLLQGIEKFSFLDDPINLDSQRPFTVSLPVESVAGNLKSIIVSVIDPSDTRQVYSFLLKLNKDRSLYEATISPLQVYGKSQVVLEIFDYEAYVVATYQTPVSFVKMADIEQDNFFPDVLFEARSLFIFSSVIIALLIFILLFVWKRRSEDNNNV